MHVVLVEPEIPPNTGTIARLCAATHTPLHLVGPLGFSLEDKYVKRAGLDYWPYAEVHPYHDWQEFVANRRECRFLAFSARATRSYTEARFLPEDYLVFGSETKGLPPALRENFKDVLFTIPIMSRNVRSLNLANAVAIVLYEAFRQLGRV